MDAHFWMGIAIGLLVPWLLFVFFYGKPQQKRNLEDANELLRERNRIGAEMLDVQWELWRQAPKLRDVFAAKALEGMIANPTMAAATHDRMEAGSSVMKEFVILAYKFADQMLEERKEAK